MADTVISNVTNLVTNAITNTMVEGRDYTCNDPKAKTICYTIGSANSGVFQTLQSQINRFVGRVQGLSAVSVDGKLGDGTARAAASVASYISSQLGGKLPTALNMWMTNGQKTRQNLATLARFISADIKAFADQRLSPAAPSTPKPSPGPSTPLQPLPGLDPFAPSIPMEEGSTDKKWWWLAGGAAVIGVSTIAFLLLKRDEDEDMRRLARLR